MRSVSELAPRELVEISALTARHLSAGRSAEWVVSAANVCEDFVRGVQVGMEIGGAKRRSAPELTAMEESVLMGYVQMLSHREIAARLDISYTLVASYIGRLRRKGAIHQDEKGGDRENLVRRRGVVELRARGERVVDIARKLGLSASTVSNDLSWVRDKLPLLAIVDADGLREHAERSGLQLGALVRATRRAREVIGDHASALSKRTGSRAKASVIAARRAAVGKLHSEGLTRREIAHRLGEMVHNVASDLSHLRGTGELEERPGRGAADAPYLDDVRRMYRAGARYAEIAESLGITRGRVRVCLRHLSDAGEIEMTRLEMSEDVKARRASVQELVGAGVRQCEIAARLGLSVAIVTDDVAWLKHHGGLPDVDGRGNVAAWRWPDRDARKKLRGRLVKMRERGMSLAEIAELVDLSPRQVGSKISYARELGEA